MELEKLTDEQLIKYLANKIAEYEARKENMIIGKLYYNYEQDIKNKMRVVIGTGGKLQQVFNLPNQKITDNQYSRAVDQKVNYLFSKEPNVDSKNKLAIDYLNNFIDMRFMRTLNQLAVDTYNHGISWLYFYTDGKDVKYKRIDPLKVIPLWQDDNHEVLDGVLLFVAKEEIENESFVTKQYVYFYTKEKIKVYKYDTGSLEYFNDEAYLKKEGTVYNYKKIPFVYFKMPGEIPLINRVKCLQDALNVLLSNYADGMLENPGNSIMVLKNYGGEDLGEFRHNLATYGAVKVETIDNVQGGVDTLEIKVNSENYKVIIELLKKAISQNAKSLYLDNDKTTQSPNQLNIKSMYSDMELDANKLELEFTASFEYMFSFINIIKNIDFSDCKIKFKRNIMVNEESKIEMIKNSVGIISDETLIANHPFVESAEDEIKKVKQQKTQDDYEQIGKVVMDNEA